MIVRVRIWETPPQDIHGTRRSRQSGAARGRGCPFVSVADIFTVVPLQTAHSITIVDCSQVSRVPSQQFVPGTSAKLITPLSADKAVEDSRIGLG